MSDWGAVAAERTDPAALARVVALATDAPGRAALRAAVTADDDLFGRAVQLGPQLLPTPSGSQRAAADGVAAAWAELGVRASLRGDPAWPARLGRVTAPPLLLAWRGPSRLPESPAVALVGARRATQYGTGVAAWLAEAAARAGATVVSGGAVGIDAAAHSAALDHATTVVLGCGHATRYPRAHARPEGLFDRVLDGGGAIVSELLPHGAPHPGNVRSRNRIVAGLADLVVVVEGGPTSGALVTAGEAADAGIPVLAVPGDVRAPGSAAPHRLLAEGAGPCVEPADVLAALRGRLAVPGSDGVTDSGGVAASDPALSVLPHPVAVVLGGAWPRPVRTDVLAARSGLPVGTVLAAVTRGRVAGEVVETADGVRLTRPPAADSD